MNKNSFILLHYMCIFIFIVYLQHYMKNTFTKKSNENENDRRQ